MTKISEEEAIRICGLVDKAMASGKVEEARKLIRQAGRMAAILGRWEVDPAKKMGYFLSAAGAYNTTGNNAHVAQYYTDKVFAIGRERLGEGSLAVVGPGQTWRVYAPEGRDVSRDVKANLRTMSNNAHLLGRGERYVIPNIRDDYGDDTYSMEVNKEVATVVAREKGQRAQIAGIFDDRKEGIFFCVTDANFREAEGKLVKAFF